MGGRIGQQRKETRTCFQNIFTDKHTRRQYISNLQSLHQNTRTTPQHQSLSTLLPNFYNIFAGWYQWDGNWVIFQESFVKQHHYRMYCTTINNPFAMPLAFSYGNAPVVAPIVNLLRQALRISLAKYAERSGKQGGQTQQSHEDEGRQENKVNSSSTLLPEGRRPATSKQSEKSSEAESQKTIQQTLPPSTPVQPPLQNSPNFTHFESQDQVTLPSFQLPASQRQAKLQSLLSRRVDSWKKERSRRRATRLAYNWC